MTKKPGPFRPKPRDDNRPAAAEQQREKPIAQQQQPYCCIVECTADGTVKYVRAGWLDPNQAGASEVSLHDFCRILQAGVVQVAMLAGRLQAGREMLKQKKKKKKSPIEVPGLLLPPGLNRN